LKLAARRQAIDEGDAAYARGEFTAYTKPGQLAAELKAKLRIGHAADTGLGIALHQRLDSA
jgi:hypothetical protein